MAASLVAACVSLIVLVATCEPLPVGVVYDDAVYLDLAHSLSRSLDYRIEHLPGAPPGIRYPPVYPTWLALWEGVHRGIGIPLGPQEWRLFGNALLAAIAAGLWTLWGTRRLQLPAAASALMAVAATLVVPARMVIDVLFSEPMGWILLGGAALAWPVANGRGRIDVRLLAAAAVIALLPVSRTIFLPVFLAALIHTLLEKRWLLRHRVLAAIIMSLPLVLWTAWSNRGAAQVPAPWWGNYGSYTSVWLGAWDGVGDLLRIAALNLNTLVHFAFVLWWLGAGIGVCCLSIGLVKLWRVQPWLVVGVLGYGAIVLLFPFQTRRFVAGILPLLSVATGAGAVALLRVAARKPALRAVTAAALLLPVGSCVRATSASYRDGSWRQAWRSTVRSYAPFVAWGQRLAASTKVVTESDGLFGLATGLPTAPALPWSPRDYLNRGPPPAARLSASLCETGEGWLGLVDANGEISSVLRDLMSRSDSSLRFGVPSPLGERGLVVSFACATTSAGASDGQLHSR